MPSPDGNLEPLCIAFGLPPVKGQIAGFFSIETVDQLEELLLATAQKDLPVTFGFHKLDQFASKTKGELLALYADVIPFPLSFQPPSDMDKIYFPGGSFEDLLGILDAEISNTNTGWAIIFQGVTK